MKYDRRFTKDEFKEEIIKHVKGKPEDFTDSDFDRYGEAKARHYDKSMALLDEVAEKLKQLAATHPDKNAQKEADFSIQKINDSISAIGQSAFDFNHMWDMGVAAERKKQKQSALKEPHNKENARVA